MKCPKCSHPNEEGALFCNHCGSSLIEGKKDWNSILLLAWCVSLIFFFVAHFINSRLITPYVLQNYDMTTGIKYIQISQTIISICATLTSLIIPFAIPKMTYKIIAFIIVILTVIGSIIVNCANLSAYLSNY